MLTRKGRLKGWCSGRGRRGQLRAVELSQLRAIENARLSPGRRLLTRKGRDCRLQRVSNRVAWEGGWGGG